MTTFTMTLPDAQAEYLRKEAALHNISIEQALGNLIAENEKLRQEKAYREWKMQLKKQHELSRKNGTSNMSMEDIDQEIALVRAQRSE